MSDPRVKRFAPYAAAVVAMLLALLIPVPHEKLSQLVSAPAPPPPAGAPATTATTAGAVPNLPPRTGGGSSSNPAAPAGAPASAPAGPRPNPPLASPAPELPPGEAPSAPATCDAQAAVDGIDTALKSADTLTGGVVPAHNLSTLIAIAAKCSDKDPTLTLVGLINELGQGLPDLGLPGLPVLPPLDLPPFLVDLLGPLGPLTAPACAQLGTVGTVLLIAAGNYPEPLASTMSNLAFGTLGPCTQLHPPQ